MARARIYRHIGRRPRYLGLEPLDALLLAGLLWVLLTFHRNALASNALIVVAAYTALRLAKRGKPDGYTTDVIRYAFSRRTFLSAAEIDEVGRSRPFRPTTHDTQKGCIYE